MKNSRILITGAGGFIGSHVAELFAAKGYHVKAFIHYNSQNSFGWLDHSSLLKDMEVVAGDIRDYDSVAGAMKDCDSVLHLAALIGIPYSIYTPGGYLKTNITGTYNILYAALQREIKSVVVTSTSEVFGTARYLPMDEKHPLSTRSPYAASKAAADQLAMSFYHSYGLPVKIIRPFNTYGPRQSARAVIPGIIVQALNRQKTIRIGNDYPTRDFTFVTDLAEAYLKVNECRNLNGKSINIGTNSEISVINLAKKIIHKIDPGITIQPESTRARHDELEVKQLRCDNTLIVSQTNWKPEHNIDNGLDLTIEWFREHMQLYKPNLYNI